MLCKRMVLMVWQNLNSLSQDLTHEPTIPKFQIKAHCCGQGFNHARSWPVIASMDVLRPLAKACVPGLKVETVCDSRVMHKL